MVRLAPVFAGIVRYGGVLVLILGIFLWTGNFDVIMPYHMALGILVVVALWLQAIAYAMTGRANMGVVIAAFVLGLAQAALGGTQQQILPDGGHWIIQVIHLLLGLAVIGIGERIAMTMKRDARAAIN